LLQPNNLFKKLIVIFFASVRYEKRRDLLTPQLRHWYAFNGTLSGTPDWACLESCPLSEITSFELDSSRSRKSVFKLLKSHTSFSRHPRIEGTGQVIMQAAIFVGFIASRANGIGFPSRPRNGVPAHLRKSLLCRGPGQAVPVQQRSRSPPSVPVLIRGSREGSETSKARVSHDRLT